MPKIRKQHKKSKCKRLSIHNSSRKPPQQLLLECQTEKFDTISITRLTLPIFKMNPKALQIFDWRDGFEKC